jgi:hypothetical protein
MTPEDRMKTAADLAGILARGYDWHIEVHGPDSNHAIRASKGDRYEVVQTDGGATSFILCDGERFAVSVWPMARLGWKLPATDTTPAPQHRQEK